MVNSISLPKLARKTLRRLLIIMGVTVVISAIYKMFIQLEFFSIFPAGFAFDFVFCITELLLLGLYWFYLYIFARKCRHRSPSLRFYYISTLIVLSVYSAVYLLLHRLLSRNAFLWVFRITLGLGGLALKTVFPDNLLPLMSIYLVITWAIMLLEPYIAKMRRKYV